VSDGGSGSGGGDGGQVTFSVDLSKGPMRQFQPPAKPVPISPYVYGINAFAISETTTKWGLVRQGGDATTTWNWTNNYSNSGADYCFYQNQDSGGDALAGSITSAQSIFPISTAQSLGIPYLVTVPIVDYVSAAYDNDTAGCPESPLSCASGSPNGLDVNTGNLDFASTDPGSTAFVGNLPSKSGSYCTCQPGAPCAAGCAPSTSGAVYEDEFVNFLKVTYGSGGAPVFTMLDNEPNYWPTTHPEIWPYTGTLGCGTDGTVTFDDVVTRDTAYATAIRTVWPETKIFGPVVAQDGIIYAHDYNDPNLPTTFSDYYLAKMAASAAAGMPLIDVFDVHYYSYGGSEAQCVQVPRLFWDPNFTDFSPSVTDGIDFGWSGPNNYFDTNFYPRQMIPRLLGKIATAYGSAKTTAPGLSFSEYSAGCETQIEGGVAQADMLGIFGREGVYAATAWPLDSITDSNKRLTNYLVAAYGLYRNYDGKGSVVGDTAVMAATSDVEDTSVYAFAHSNDVSRVDLLAINKTNAPLPVTIDVSSTPTLTVAGAYQLTSASVAVVPVTASAPVIACADCSCALSYTLPAMSATTLVLQ
jgi:hypothetical protein